MRVASLLLAVSLLTSAVYTYVCLPDTIDPRGAKAKWWRRTKRPCAYFARIASSRASTTTHAVMKARNFQSESRTPWTRAPITSMTIRRRKASNAVTSLTPNHGPSERDGTAATLLRASPWQVSLVSLLDA